MADPTAPAAPASSPFEKAKQAANDLRQDAAEGIHRAEEALKKGVETSREKLHDAIDTTAERVDQAHMFLKEQARERPIAVTAAAVGVGVLVGILLANNGGRRR